jgi:hypothetical protein
VGLSLQENKLRDCVRSFSVYTLCEFTLAHFTINIEISKAIFEKNLQKRYFNNKHANTNCGRGFTLFFFNYFKFFKMKDTMKEIKSLKEGLARLILLVV